MLVDATPSRGWNALAKARLAGKFQTRRFAALAGLGLQAAWPSQANAQDAEDYLQFRWYRIEVVVFQQSDEEDPGAARPQLLDAMRYPHGTMPLAEGDPDDEEPLPFGPSLPANDPLPLVVSNLAPPLWFADECATEFWEPPFEFGEDGGMLRDPCLPELELWDIDPQAEDFPALPMTSPDEEAPLPAEPEPVARDAAREKLASAFEEHEKQLFETSYAWRRETPGFAAELRRLRRRFEVLAAGSWHQPVPPRQQPQPLLVQVGRMDELRRFPLEGWFSVTVGRYLHFEAHLQYRLPDGDGVAASGGAPHDSGSVPHDSGTALFAERRRMRSDEPHYLDHPALGILVRIDPVAVPRDLLRLIDELQELGQQPQ